MKVTERGELNATREPRKNSTCSGWGSQRGFGADVRFLTGLGFNQGMVLGTLSPTTQTMV